YDPNMNDTGALPSLLSNTGIQTLRYPGGGYSDSYHWANFSITPYFSSASPACSQTADGYLASDGDFGTFVKLVRASGAQAMITVNYGTSVADALGSKTYGSDAQRTCSEPNTFGQPQEAAAWVAYANGSASSTQLIGKDATGFDWKTVGYWASMRAAFPLSSDDGYNFLRIGVAAPVGIKYWEIGNELYYNGWATNHNAEADNHAPYVYPSGYTPGGYNSRASLDALSPTSYGTNAIQWIQAMKAVDPTIQIGVDFSSPISTDPIPLNWNPDLAKAVCAGSAIDFAIMHYYPGTWKAVLANDLLTLPQADIPNVVTNIRSALASGCPTTAATTKIFLTETSPNGALAPGFPAQALGLFAINNFLTSLKSGVGNVNWLEMHDGTYLTSGESPGPAYYGIEMAHLLASPGDSVLSTFTSSGTVLTWATTKTNGHHGLLLVNADADNPAIVQVTLNATVNGSASKYSYGVGITPSGPSLSGTPATLAGSGVFTVTVPAYQAVELDIP
ncbi:MAG: Ig family protein, partial [Acidobacteriota bacterium]